MISQDQMPISKPAQPAEWAWIVQRQQTDGKAASIWKFGFLAPDGAEVRVTFHQVAQEDMGATQPKAKEGPPAPEAASNGEPNDAAGTPPPPSMKEDFGGQDQSAGPSADPPSPQSPPADPPTPQGASDSGFRPAGTPTPDQTDSATFYVTFFSNRNPEWFMKWDTSLDHEQSLTTWVTITHGIIDFLRKAKPANLILDDLANGKLKMVLRSIAMDLVATNPDYELEQTQKHHYRSFYQVKRKGVTSAFELQIKGNDNIEGETPTPQPHDMTNGPQMPAPPSGAIPADVANGPSAIAGNKDKTEDPTQPQPGDGSGNPKEANPAFPSANDLPIQKTQPEIKQTPHANRGLTVEIGKDYSVAVRDQSGNPIDRYRGKNPADILRWIKDKGFAGSQMKIVDREQMGPVATQEGFEIKGKAIHVHTQVPLNQIVMMSYIANPSSVRNDGKDVIFEYANDKDMDFKRALVELAYEQTGMINAKVR